MEYKKFSFVIPCYQSENSIEMVLDEIEEVMRQNPELSYEVIAINDNSPDHVYQVLKKRGKADNRIKILDLSKNCGKHSALMAGYHYVDGDIIVNIDDDGQCPLDKLWELIEPLKQGYDISIAKYKKKKQSALKNFGSFINAKMAQYLLHKPPKLQLSNFSAMKRFVCMEILKYQNPYPYIDGLFLRTTDKIANVSMEERNRESGVSGYTFFKSLNLWLNGFTAFSVVPLRAATFLGIGFSFVGIIFGVWVIIRKIFTPNIVAGYSSLMAALLFISGIIMLILGLMGEYIGRIYISINNSPQYVIREIINVSNSPSCLDD